MGTRADDLHIPSAAEMRHNLRERIGAQESELARVTRQRDAAVEALRRILGLQEEYDGESFETTFLAAENIARAALALCEEKP